MTLVQMSKKRARSPESLDLQYPGCEQEATPIKPGSMWVCMESYQQRFVSPVGEIVGKRLIEKDTFVKVYGSPLHQENYIVFDGSVSTFMSPSRGMRMPKLERTEFLNKFQTSRINKLVC